ncbi:MAG: hypothetical protein HFG48_00215 [Bacilli bacterium]|nr:hypothetical protein [Bacilli bacterium]
MIILDEPFNGVENETARKIRKILLEEKARGKLIIIATHMKADIEKSIDSNNIYEVDDGKVKQYTK